MAKLRVGILVFPRVQQLDLTGPYEVFATTGEAEVRLVWKRIERIETATGLVLMPDLAFADCPQFDVLCVPGGIGVNSLMEDEEVLGFLRRQAEGARYVTSVCTGSRWVGTPRSSARCA
jgi:cyclohexyl-isocyanide hydratase